MEHFTRDEAAGFVSQPPGGTRRGASRGLALAAAGAGLAAAAFVVRRRTQEAERRNPPIGRFIEVDGILLHYLERGQGQPLVLLHGAGSMIQDFETSGLIGMAAKNHRVIVFDRPGYGYSERPRSTIWTPERQARLLHRALQQLGVEQPVILGHSWGAIVAVALGLNFPADVKSLVLVSGYYYPTPRIDMPLMSAPAIPVVGDLLRYTVSPLAGRAIWPAMLRHVFGPAPVPERFRAGFPVWMNLRPSQIRAAAAEATLAIPAVFNLRHRYHELLMPVVILAGDADRHVDMAAHSERLHQELPHSTLRVTAGAGHMLHHVAQREVMEAIEQAEHGMGAVELAQTKAAFPSPAWVS